MTAAAIACRDLTVRYRDQVVLDVPALEIAAGETVAVIGPNGAGKSTLLGVLGLTLAPTTGTVWIGGEPVSSPARARRARRRVTTQLQESLLLDGTVGWNVALPLRLRGLGREQIGARVARWARAFDIEPLLGRRVAGLSGGEARRTCLARVFAVEPEALLIDEPLAGVDAPFREEILVRLAAALAPRPWTTLMITHDLAEGLRLADRLVIMVGGSIRQIGTPAEVLASPSDPDVARLVGTDTYVHGRGETAGGMSRIRIGDAAVTVAQPIEADGEVWVAIRPEDVTLFVGDQRPAGGAQNYLPATVVELRPRGAIIYVVLDAGFRLGAVVLPSTVDALDLRPGRKVWASVKATAVRRV